MKNNTPFIVFEGIDGSGKSTQAGMLYDYIVDIGSQAYLGFEPTDEKWGKEIRNILRGSEFPSGTKMVDLFIKDRHDDANLFIKPNLQNGIPVILDRYYYSNAAYQGAMGVDVDYILSENKKQNFPEPHRVYLIDITPETALERIQKRNQSPEKDLFEKKSFLETVYTIYNLLADTQDNFIKINGDNSIENIHKEIIDDFSKTF